MVLLSWAQYNCSCVPNLHRLLGTCCSVQWGKGSPRAKICLFVSNINCIFLIFQYKIINLKIPTLPLKFAVSCTNNKVKPQVQRILQGKRDHLWDLLFWKSPLETKSPFWDHTTITLLVLSWAGDLWYSDQLSWARCLGYLAQLLQKMSIRPY